MAKRKNSNNSSGYTPKKFETNEYNNVLSANIYLDMLTSPAWIDTPKNARLLYIYAKAQFWGVKEHPQNRQDYFYLNKSLVVDIYKLYTNTSQFRKDINELIKHGFIELVENGKFTRTKNIYKYSDKWKTWSK